VQVHVFVVEDAEDLVPALEALRKSMPLRDPVIGVDLEWNAELEPGQHSKVALIQLASSSMVVLIRTCILGDAVPQPVIDFCR
jgi:hypothetical protein